MKTIKVTIRKFSLFTVFIFSIATLAIQSCDTGKNEKDNAVEIITELMDFQMVDTLPAGWHTFRYINKSNETHFFILEKYPEGKNIADGKREIVPVFQEGMNLINEGKTDEGFAAFGKLPAWFSQIIFSGGTGMISPGKTCETTLKLEPGYYVIECYLKMANGMFHSAMGMLKELIVTNNSFESPAIMPNVRITISSTEGIVYKDPIVAGETIFEVHFKDQIVHENFIGHDINLVKLEENANIETLEKWMNWVDPKGLINPPPAGVLFLGGVNEMPANNTAYFKATLEPGNYAFISEVPNSSSKNMLKKFTIEK